MSASFRAPFRQVGHRLLTVLVLAGVGLLTTSCAQAQSEAPAETAPALEGGEAAPGVAWMGFEAAVQSAADQQKPLIIDIYAPWCGWCTRLQNDVYMSEPIQAYLDEHFVTTRLDIDAKDTSYQFREYNLTSPELAGGLGAQGTPTTVFLTAEAEYITRIPGYVDAEAFLNILEFIGTESFKSQTYEEFVEAKDGE